MKKIISYIVLAIVLVIVGFVSYIKFALPNVGAPENIKVESTPELVQRGSYLANSVCACMDCHSKRDWSLFAAPLVASTFGAGGEEFNQKYGFPGQFYSKNITPYALKDWTDGEILRAISSGVNKKGTALFPVMPHASYGKMDREDLYAIIAYLRTLKPIESTVPASVPDFPMSLIINTIPTKAEFSKRPAPSDLIAYGKYLLTSASCSDCHTKQDKGKPIAGMEFAGGFEFPLPSGGTVRSANITRDKETGIGDWTEADFVNRFKVYADSTYVPLKINKGDFNTYMPWMLYSTMTTNDLKAMFAYLKTIPPVKNKVEKFASK